MTASLISRRQVTPGQLLAGRPFAVVQGSGMVLPPAPWTPVDIQNRIVRWFDLSASARRTDESGAVAQVASRPIGPRSLAPAAVQATAGNRPAASPGFATFDGSNDILYEPLGAGAITYGSSVTCPDASTSTAGKGFVCTGLSRASDGTFWVGNHGWANSVSGASAEPSIFHLASDLTTVIGEYTLTALGLTPTANASVQGVVVDPRDQSVWFLKTANDPRIVHISAAGALIASFPLSVGGPFNGLGFDAVQNQLVLCERNSPVLRWFDPETGLATGQSTALPTRSDGYDQIYVDAAQDLVLATSGANGTAGFIVYLELSTGLPIRSITAANATAIEGVTVDGAGNMWVASDSFYHNATGVNFIGVYTYAQPSLRPLSTRLLIGGIFRRTATNAAGAVLFGLGDPTNNSFGGFSINHPSSTTDTLSIVVSGGAGFTAAAAVVDADATHLVIFDVDVTAKTVTPRVNGVAQAAISVPNIWTAFRANRWAIGGSRPDTTGSRYVKAEVTAAICIRDATDVEKIEGYLAWSNGLQAILDAGHLYKPAPP